MFLILINKHLLSNDIYPSPLSKFQQPLNIDLHEYFLWTIYVYPVKKRTIGL